MDKGIITDHVDFSLTNKNKGSSEHKIRVYSKRLTVKYKSLIKHVYDHLIIEELKQLRLTVEKAKVSDLIFFKTCAKCKKACYREKDIVQCYFCDYWIHNNISCYNIILKYGKYCPNYLLSYSDRNYYRQQSVKVCVSFH